MLTQRGVDLDVVVNWHKSGLGRRIWTQGSAWLATSCGATAARASPAAAVSQLVTFGGFAVLHGLQTPHEATITLKDWIDQARERRTQQGFAASVYDNIERVNPSRLRTESEAEYHARLRDALQERPGAPPASPQPLEVPTAAPKPPEAVAGPNPVVPVAPETRGSSPMTAEEAAYRLAIEKTRAMAEEETPEPARPNRKLFGPKQAKPPAPETPQHVVDEGTLALRAIGHKAGEAKRLIEQATAEKSFGSVDELIRCRFGDRLTIGTGATTGGTPTRGSVWAQTERGS